MATRDRLIDRVPDIWLRYDRDEGVLRRFFDVMDSEFDRSHDLTAGLFDLKSVDLIPDKYLPLLAPLVGHVWRSDKDRAWNRRRIRNAIRRWSYKGTLTAIGDIIRENGGVDFSVTDQASRLFTMDCFDGFDSDSSHIESEDYWHEGDYLLFLDELTDVEGVRIDLRDFLMAGTQWYFIRRMIRSGVMEMVSQEGSRPTGLLLDDMSTDFDIGVALFEEELWFDDCSAGDERILNHVLAQLFDMGRFESTITMDSTTWNIATQEITFNSGQPANLLPLGIAAHQPGSKITVPS